MAHQVTSVTEDQVEDSSGNLVDVFNIVFTVTGHPGTFTVQVAQGGDPVTEAADAIAAKEAEVQGIYGL